MATQERSAPPLRQHLPPIGASSRATPAVSLRATKAWRRASWPLFPTLARAHKCRARLPQSPVWRRPEGILHRPTTNSLRRSVTSCSGSSSSGSQHTKGSRTSLPRDDQTAAAGPRLQIAPTRFANPTRFNVCVANWCIELLRRLSHDLRQSNTILEPTALDRSCDFIVVEHHIRLSACGRAKLRRRGRRRIRHRQCIGCRWGLRQVYPRRWGSRNIQWVGRRCGGFAAGTGGAVAVAGCRFS